MAGYCPCLEPGPASFRKDLSGNSRQALRPVCLCEEDTGRKREGLKTKETPEKRVRNGCTQTQTQTDRERERERERERNRGG
jgi:hypothetical protein